MNLFLLPDGKIELRAIDNGCAADARLRRRSAIRLARDLIGKRAMKRPLASESSSATPASKPTATSASALTQIGSLMTSHFVRVPGWFSAAQAARILHQQHKELALVTDRSGHRLLAHRDRLDAAPPGKSVLWCAQPLVRAVTPQTDLAWARTLMDEHSLDHLPVYGGGLRVGVMPREALGRDASDVGGASRRLAA